MTRIEEKILFPNVDECRILPQNHVTEGGKDTGRESRREDKVVHYRNKDLKAADLEKSDFSLTPQPPVTQSLPVSRT